MAFIAPKYEGALRPRAQVNKCHTSRVHARVVTILYPEGTATIATALRCLTTRASSLVNRLLAAKLDRSVDGRTRFVATLCRLSPFSS